MDQCRCKTPPFDHRDFDARPVGVDRTNGRFGEVSVETCQHCGARWLCYSVEYEAFPQSGRWYRGLLREVDEQSLTPEGALAVLNRLPWHSYGGSYFRSRGARGVGPVAIDP